MPARQECGKCQKGRRRRAIKWGADIANGKQVNSDRNLRNRFVMTAPTTQEEVKKELEDYLDEKVCPTLTICFDLCSEQRWQFK